MGISRSATVVAAYLTFRHGLTPSQAIQYLRFQRPIVRPNSGFKEQLHDYYSVLQIDHGDDFGWRDLSMCKNLTGPSTIEELKSQRIKAKRRTTIESVRKKWKLENVEWARCAVAAWDEDMERLAQRHFSRGPIAVDCMSFGV